MKSTDYIQILYLDDTQAQFQGIAASFSALDIDTGGTGGITTAIPPQLWLAQNGVLDAQSDFLMQVKDVFSAKFVNLPKISDMRSSFAKNFLTEIFGELIAWLTQNKLYGILAEYFAGMLWDTIMFLKSFLKNYAKLCDAMKKENEALKTITPSWEHYQIRNDVMQQHYEHVQGMMNFIEVCESHAQELHQEMPKAWVKWAKDMKAMPKKINDWVDEACDAADKNHDADPDNDLPVPKPPELPDIPQADNVATMAFANLIRTQTAFLMKFSQKLIEHHEELNENIEALQYNDEEIELPGNIRLHLRGKVLEY